MKIVLKPDWDIPVQIPNKEKTETKGHFVGRETELSVFTNELLRREQGAILITGYRGVGKTSFVYKALHQVLEQSDKDKLLFVFINANHLETSSVRGTTPKPILVNLIRRLYAVAQEENLNRQLKQDIEAIYKKAVSSEFRLSEAIEKSKKSVKEAEVSRQSEFNLQQISVTQTVWLLSFILAIILQIFPAFPNLPWLNKILPLLLAFPIPLFFSWFWRYRKSSTNSEAISGSAQQLYTMDNSVNNLEFDLEKLHRDLMNAGVKTIYAIDELDKLDANVVSEIMRYFKNLFTLSSALFVFIGGEELFERYQVIKKDDYSNVHRSTEYTYFTSKYFLSRPTDTDVLRYLDEITANYDELANNIEFEYYKRSLIFESNCDYFDLIQVMKGKIRNFDELYPVLDVNMEQANLLKAKLQKSLSVVFNEKYISLSPIKWSENETMLRGLYEHAQLLFSINPGTEVENKSSNYDILEYAKNDLNSFLCRLEFLETAGYFRQTNRYYRTNKFAANVPEAMSYQSQIEEMLVAGINKIYQIVTNYWNIYAICQDIPTITISEFANNPIIYAYKINHWGIDAKNAISELEPLYKWLNEQPGISLNRDDVEKYTAFVDEVIDRLIVNSTQLLARIFQESFNNYNLQIMELGQNENLFNNYPPTTFYSLADSDSNFFRKRMLEVNISHQILVNSDYSVQLMFCSELPNELLEHFQYISTDNDFKAAVVITDYKYERKLEEYQENSFNYFSLIDDKLEIERKVERLTNILNRSLSKSIVGKQ